MYTPWLGHDIHYRQFTVCVQQMSKRGTKGSETTWFRPYRYHIFYWMVVSYQHLGGYEIHASHLICFTSARRFFTHLHRRKPRLKYTPLLFHCIFQPWFATILHLEASQFPTDCRFRLTAFEQEGSNHGMRPWI
jgi:hypothetical protein